MPDVDTSKEAKSSLGKEISEDAMILADLYCQLEFLLGDLKKIPPTAAEVEAMAVTLFIDRQKRSGRAQVGTEDSPRPSPGRQSSDESSPPAEKECPECGLTVSPTYSQAKRVWYYKCPDCQVFINKDGTTTKVGGGKRRH